MYQTLTERPPTGCRSTFWGGLTRPCIAPQRSLSGAISPSADLSFRFGRVPVLARLLPSFCARVTIYSDHPTPNMGPAWVRRIRNFCTPFATLRLEARRNHVGPEAMTRLRGNNDIARAAGRSFSAFVPQYGSGLSHRKDEENRARHVKCCTTSFVH